LFSVVVGGTSTWAETHSAIEVEITEIFSQSVINAIRYMY
jgi:hypothetical protein